MPNKKKTRKGKVAEQRESVKKRSSSKKIEFVGNVLFFVGIVLLIFTVSIFENTMMAWQIPFFICLLTGLVSAVLFSKFWNTYIVDELGNSHMLLTLFYNFIAVGGIVAFLFMAGNAYAPEVEIKTHKLKILEKSSRSGSSRWKRSPVVDIRYKRKIKRIGFTSRDKQKVDAAVFLILHTKVGNFGYDVIVEKALTK